MANEVVVISGIKETTAALKKFDKDAARRLNKVINDELRLAEGNAKEQIPDKPPMSGWRTDAGKEPTKDHQRWRRLAIVGSASHSPGHH
jgi:hypothetical protein